MFCWSAFCDVLWGSYLFTVCSWSLVARWAVNLLILNLDESFSD